MSNTNPSKIMAAGAVSLLLTGAADIALSLHSHSATGRVGACMAAIGALVALTNWMQLRLQEREKRERREFESVQHQKAGSALFSETQQTFRAEQARASFDRWIAPLLTLLIGLTQIGLCLWLWRLRSSFKPLLADRVGLALAVFGLLSLILFLFGKYALIKARYEGIRSLKPVANFVLLLAFLNGLSAVAAGCHWAGIPQADGLLATGFIGLLGLLGLETGIHLVLGFYRPRSQRSEAPPVYESRLLGLLTEPETLFHTAAQSLDYQFGFKVSETWFYRYLEQRLVGLVALQLAVVWISTTLVMIEPHQEGVRERFGQVNTQQTTLGPGLHFKLPWPIDHIEIRPTRQLQQINLGFLPDPELQKEKTLLWTRSHYKEEFNLLVATQDEIPVSSSSSQEQSVPVNLITVSIPMQFQVTNLLQWAYRHANGVQLLESLATREVVRYLVTVDVHHLMSYGRLEAAESLRRSIQAEAERHQLGVEILFLGLQDIHPPVEVVSAYEGVIGATQERETKILKAQGYQAEHVPMARAEAFKKVESAQGERRSQILSSAAKSERFRHQLAAWNASPDVYARHAYHETFHRATEGARKFVLMTTNLHEHYWLNFEDKLRPDLLDVTVPPSRKPSERN
ncbi:MAG: protease modulator HflK [Verrucomicrobiales bacterium]|nr:protease modulator HflK [Verrucomicrobiales bacterium]